MATNSGAVDPHCGVCQHSSCNDEETPFCSEWDQQTTIRVGTVCSEFSPTAGTGSSSSSAERTIDRAGEGPSVDELPGDDDLRVRGSNGSFYAAYETDGETRYGWFCDNCQSLDVVMDSMGRIVCTNCDNGRKPTDWDAAYL